MWPDRPIELGNHIRLLAIARKIPDKKRLPNVTINPIGQSNRTKW